MDIKANPLLEKDSYNELKEHSAEGSCALEPSHQNVNDFLWGKGFWSDRSKISFDSFQGFWRWTATIGKLEAQSCVSCRDEFMGRPPQMCCSGYECGCMGQPIDPVVCSDNCYDEIINRYK